MRPFKSPKLIGFLGIALTLSTATAVQSKAAPLGLLSTELRPLWTELLSTDEGAEFAKALLGARAGKFNVGGASEVINTLMQAENAELATVMSKRIESIRSELSKIDSDGRLSIEERAARHRELVRSESKRLLTMRGDWAQTGRITFVEDGASAGFRSARENYRDEFLMGGKRVSLKGRPADDRAPAPKGFRQNAFEQFLQWEEHASLGYFRESTQFFKMKVATVDPAKVEIRAATGTPDSVIQLFEHDGKVFWPSHPFNSSKTIPFAGEAPVENWSARMTASRSMVVWNKETGEAFSLKAPTDYPHRTERQVGKADLSDDIDSALGRTEYIRKMDESLGGTDDKVEMLGELMTLEDKASGNGIVVRDLRPLMNGNYFLPALSIPYAGESIAKLNGKTVDEFFGKEYAEKLGRAKARLLIRYGIQMETPNSQNMLIEFDRSMRPTGRLIFRDVSDSFTVRPILEALRKDDLLMHEVEIGYNPQTFLNPMTNNSFWRLDEDATQGISPEVLEKWKGLHDQGYIDEVLTMLKANRNAPEIASISTFAELQKWLFSDAGRAAVWRFHNLR
jgi:hypothetical protein